MPSDITTGIMGFVLLLVLLAIRVPVGTAMLAVGAGGIWVLHPRGEVAVFATLAGESFSVSSLYSLTILPLFVLMGNLSGVSGMSRDLYNAAHAWFGHLKGGLASSTIVGCAGFSALSGSSLASAVTMGRVAIPEMKRFNYSDALSTGSVAAGGTLGILIPPSAGFVDLCHPDRGKHWPAVHGRRVAGTDADGLVHRGNHDPGEASTPSLHRAFCPRCRCAERLRALARARWIIGIVVITVGGIYGGVFSAVEAAGIGAFLAFVCHAPARRFPLAGNQEGHGRHAGINRNHLLHPDGCLCFHTLCRTERHTGRPE